MACDDRLALIPFGFESDVHLLVPHHGSKTMEQSVDRLE